MSVLQLTLDMSQRWLFGKPKYRPSRETIQPADYDIAEIPDDTTARDFISKHHYSGSMGAARVRVGLYRRGELVGVAVFSHPCSDAVLTRTFPVPPARTVELGRFVLLNEVEANGESYFLARAFEILRSRGMVGVVTWDRVSGPQWRLPRARHATNAAPSAQRTCFARAYVLRPSATANYFGRHRSAGAFDPEDSRWRTRLESWGRASRALRCARRSQRCRRTPGVAGRGHSVADPPGPAPRQPQVRVAADGLNASSASGQPAISEAPGHGGALIMTKGGSQMRFWFVFAAMMGPKFFGRFVILFALGMALMLYSLVQS